MALAERTATFSAALTEHLDALQARDIERFAATLSRSPELRVVAPNGTITQGFAAVRDAHAEWFASSDQWTFEPAVMWRREGPEMGFALLDVTYRNTPADAATRFLLSLLFIKESDGWRFVYDQNTPLPT